MEATLEGTNTQRLPSTPPATNPHTSQGHHSHHAHGLFCLLLGISCLLLSELLCHLGLPLNLSKALVAHLLSSQAFLGTQPFLSGCWLLLANNGAFQFQRGLG